MRLEMPWPDLASYPDYGLVRTRTDFDEILARHAQKSGARLQESTGVTGPMLDERAGRIAGVTARPLDDDGRPTGPAMTFRRRWSSPPTACPPGCRTAMGIRKRDDRPMGVAVRTYYRTPRHDDDWLESWLELWEKDRHGEPKLLPGYGWIFGIGDGTSNVGLGVLNTSTAFGQVDYKQLLRRWLAQTPPEWGFTEENRVGASAAPRCPWRFNRQPHYDRGLLLVGDSGGMVNPFNGEGIAYAMEAASLAATVIAEARAPDGPTRTASGSCADTQPRSSRNTVATSPSGASS